MENVVSLNDRRISDALTNLQLMDLSGLIFIAIPREGDNVIGLITEPDVDKEHLVALLNIASNAIVESNGK